MQKTNLDFDVLRNLAFMQYNQEPFFILNGVAYEGTEKEARQQWEGDVENLDGLSETPDFEEWVADNCLEVGEFDNDDYLVLTDEEADEKAKEYILDSAWAFNPSFLSEFTGIDIQVFESIQSNNRCEGNNNAILSMIDDEDDFAQMAISADGRGHFLSSYDGNESEGTVEGETFYIFRQN